mmetsp:Transcript_10468/g.23055  ORF Transcript_10468/g.23055 Transcript_10468/m.23055 type:complete len:582 (+) Transcript_10468:78-1823(+)|eukprot:CAMPEP_0206455240 /NCGR_PEP_ID=MMETSP0324_2-20121206/21637_1 /ASSEMBLY_ACC=CAM_ASM_000836 /TAXON_ID=2866 /ORGANISM="Crypthecodinium cohnii, Strain Seligo" /LENGTH=581 /DNA_ID=CAMNT_0053925911 /DNA_START=43 /DNA_END=1788 /DNA_ORIENTATION=+
MAPTAAAAAAASKRKATEAATPGTPPKRRMTRALEREISAPKEPVLLRGAKGKSASVVIKEEPKRAEEHSVVEVPAKPAPLPEKQYAKGSPQEEAYYAAMLDKHGVPESSESSRPMLLNQLRRWGVARSGQVMKLYDYLGDGQSQGIALHELQVWGPPGVGKTAVLDGYLSATGLRNIVLNPGCFVSFGEFLARMIEELRRCVVATVPGCNQDLLQPLAYRQVRVVDRMEAALKPILQQLAEASSNNELDPTNKVVIVIDNAHELPNLHSNALETLLKLDQVLQLPCMEHLVFVFVSQLPLRQLGIYGSREPLDVSFQVYSRSEAEKALTNALQSKLEDQNTLVELIPSEEELRSIVNNGVMEFAAPHLGHNLEDLIRIGEGLLLKPEVVGSSAAVLQKEVAHLVHRRHCLPSLAKLLNENEVSVSPEVDAIQLSMRSLTKVQKRLLLAAYLGSHIDLSEDVQLFLPGGKGRRYRKKKQQQDKRKVAKGPQEESPFLKEPQPVVLPRLLSIYHRIANCSQHLLSTGLLERLMTLRDMALIRFEKQINLERDAKVVCCADLPLARACAEELNVDLAEYLCSW